MIRFCTLPLSKIAASSNSTGCLPTFNSDSAKTNYLFVMAEELAAIKLSIITVEAGDQAIFHSLTRGGVAVRAAVIQTSRRRLRPNAMMAMSR